MSEATELLDSIQFKNIVTFLKNAGKETSAAWLVVKVGDLSVKDAIAYRNNCRISPCGDIGLMDMNEIKMQHSATTAQANGKG